MPGSAFNARGTRETRASNCRTIIDFGNHYAAALSMRWTSSRFWMAEARRRSNRVFPHSDVARTGTFRAAMGQTMLDGALAVDGAPRRGLLQLAELLLLLRLVPS
jgi:hypothetical protein